MYIKRLAVKMPFVNNSHYFSSGQNVDFYDHDAPWKPTVVKTKHFPSLLSWISALRIL